MTAEYFGPERRHRQRRQLVDRRMLVRWEPGKADRRQGYGRRKGEQWSLI